MRNEYCIVLCMLTVALGWFSLLSTIFTFASGSGISQSCSHSIAKILFSSDLVQFYPYGWDSA